MRQNDLECSICDKAPPTTTRRNSRSAYALRVFSRNYNTDVRTGPKWPGYVITASLPLLLVRRLMPQAIVDPIELRRFAHNLKKFNQELEEQLTSLRAQLNALGSTWRDQEHKKFVEDFDEHMKVIAKYVEATNEHAPYLLRKAERIEEYLQQR